MKSLIALFAVAFLLTGCVTERTPRSFGPDLINSLDQNSLISPADDQAVVVIGYRALDPDGPQSEPVIPSTFGSWVQIDPKTLARSGQKMPFFLLSGGTRTRPPNRSTLYRVYALAPGRYALAWVKYGVTFQPTRFVEISSTSQSHGYDYTLNYSFSQKAVARPIAPVFDANAGDVIYIGDVVFDFRIKDHLGWTFDRNDDQARLFLSKTGLAERMTYQQPKRADGTAIPSNDGVEFNWYE